MQSGEKEFEVGRTSYSRKYDVYSKTLYPVDEEGNPIKKGRAKWTLFKRPTGVTLGHGGMGTVIKSFRKASANDQVLKRAFVPDSVDGWLEWADSTRTAAKEPSVTAQIKQLEQIAQRMRTYLSGGFSDPLTNKSLRDIEKQIKALKSKKATTQRRG